MTDHKRHSEAGLDPARIHERLAFIRGEVSALRALVRKTPQIEEMFNDAWLRRGVGYALQTTIEAMADVCYHIAAKRFRRAPSDPHEAIDLLGQEEVLPPDLLPSLHGMVGLRNRLVHGYLGVDDRRLVAMLQQGLGDFESFVEAIMAMLSTARPTGD